MSKVKKANIINNEQIETEFNSVRNKSELIILAKKYLRLHKKILKLQKVSIEKNIQVSIDFPYALKNLDKINLNTLRGEMSKVGLINKRKINLSKNEKMKLDAAKSRKRVKAGQQKKTEISISTRNSIRTISAGLPRT
jgi:hypothetical protein